MLLTFEQIDRYGQIRCTADSVTVCKLRTPRIEGFLLTDKGNF